MSDEKAATPSEPRQLDLVHRTGATLAGVVIIGFGVLGLTGGLGFFETSGAPVAGLNSNGLLSVISLVTGVVLLGSAVRGGRTASSVTAGIGVLFILSGLLNLALLETSFNVLAFRIPNVFFSLIAGLVLLVVGLYGRVSGGLPADNPYRRLREAKAGRSVSAEEEADEEHAREVTEMAKLELLVAEGKATPEQERRIAADRERRAKEEHDRAWAHARKTGQGVPERPLP